MDCTFTTSDLQKDFRKKGENGGKQPKDYTWDEFEALSAELQMIFQNSFDSFEDFDAWLQRVNP